MWLAGGTHIIYSTDGLNWTISTSANSFISGGGIVCMAWGAGKFVVVGNTSGNAAQFMITSSDGITWTQSTSGSSLIAGKVDVSSFWRAERETHSSQPIPQQHCALQKFRHK